MELRLDDVGYKRIADRRAVQCSAVQCSAVQQTIIDPNETFPLRTRHADIR